jgi:hypothetical protein
MTYLLKGFMGEDLDDQYIPPLLISRNRKSIEPSAVVTGPAAEMGWELVNTSA